MLGRVASLGMWWDRYHLRGFGWFPTMNFYFIGAWRRGQPRAADDAASAAWMPIGTLVRRRRQYAWRHMTALIDAVAAHLRA